MANKWGYARVSSDDQDLSIQRSTLTEAGCKHIFEEKVSGASRKGREQLDALLKIISKGDTIIVTRIDRLARSLRDLQNIVHDLKAQGVALKATEQPIDTGTAAGKAFMDMLGVFAEFENNLRRDRQMEGIQKAKAEGRYNGRPRSIGPDQRNKIILLKKEGVGATEIGKRMGISRRHVYRILEEQ